MTSLRAVLFLVVAFATSNSAFGAFVFMYARAETVTIEGWLTDAKSETTNALSATSAQGPTHSDTGGFAFPGFWRIRANATAANTEENFGAYAVGQVQVQVDDVVTPSTDSPYGEPLDVIEYTQHFSIEGTSSGGAGSPSEFTAITLLNVLHDHTILISERELLTSISGFVETMPRGDQSWSVQTRVGEPFNFHLTVETQADASSPDGFGPAQSHTDFQNTFRWGEVTDVRNVTTGQSIPANFFHLYGEDGFDWAHPNAVPEPSSLVLATLVLLGGCGLVGGQRQRRAPVTQIV